MKRMWMAVTGLALAVAIVGCGSPPEEAEQAANEAIASAESMKAAKYAPEQWKMAEDTLQAARSARVAQDDRFALFRSYGDAERQFNRTTELAAAARAEAEAQMAIVQNEARQLIDQTTMAIDSLSTRLATVRVRKDSRAEIEMMKQDVMAFAQQLQEAEADFTNGDYDAARTKAMAVEEKVQTMAAGLK